VLGTDVFRRLEVLEESECRSLLTTAPIGRLAFTEGALPAIQPVHFVVVDHQIIIPTRMGSKVAAASRGAVVAFEVDEFDADARTGWDVTVIGPSRVVEHPDQVRALDRLGVRAWAPPDVPCYVAVQMSIVRGRRLVSGVRSDAGTSGPR
jgi:nitroimidazol reductase NimA-like FMN-containing flavoprotein (pyridoxamine 5'-phosphate oxidase superfamily)